MRIAFIASLCLAMFACGQGGTLSGNSGRKTADSRSSRNSGESKKETKNKEEKPEQTEASNEDDSNNEESRVVAPEVVTAAYLTCSAALSQAKPQPEGIRYFGCIAVDSNKNRIDLKNVKVQYLLKDMQGVALSVPTIDLPDANQDVVWAIPIDVYMKGVKPEAKLSVTNGTEATLPRKCTMKVGNVKDGFVDQESQCKAPA